MVAVQNIKGEIIQLILSRKGGVVRATNACETDHLLLVLLNIHSRNKQWTSNNLTDINRVKVSLCHIQEVYSVLEVKVIPCKQVSLLLSNIFLLQRKLKHILKQISKICFRKILYQQVAHLIS